MRGEQAWEIVSVRSAHAPTNHKSLLLLAQLDGVGERERRLALELDRQYSRFARHAVTHRRGLHVGCGRQPADDDIVDHVGEHNVAVVLIAQADELKAATARGHRAEPQRVHRGADSDVERVHARSARIVDQLCAHSRGSGIVCISVRDSVRIPPLELVGVRTVSV